VTNCGSGWALLAVKKGVQQAHLYYIPAYNGSNTRFTYVGRIGTTWSASRTAGFWSDAEVPLRQWNP
jgi:tricorn protease-like protein